jgi:hypothetical protein
MPNRPVRRNIVACGYCGANFDASGENASCPACGKSTSQYAPQPVRPLVSGYESRLESPDLLRARDDDDDETAPVEEFIAAGLIVIAFAVIITSMAVRSPLGLQLGLALFALTGIGFGIFKLYQFATGKRKPRDPEAYEPPSMMEWFMGLGFWDRRGK